MNKKSSEETTPKRGTHYLPVTATSEKGHAALTEIAHTGVFNRRDIILFAAPEKGAGVFLIETTSSGAWPHKRDLWQAGLVFHDGKGVPKNFFDALMPINEHLPLPAGHSLTPAPAVQWAAAEAEVSVKPRLAQVGLLLVRSVASLARKIPRLVVSRG